MSVQVDDYLQIAPSTVSCEGPISPTGSYYSSEGLEEAPRLVKPPKHHRVESQISPSATSEDIRDEFAIKEHLLAAAEPAGDEQAISRLETQLWETIAERDKFAANQETLLAWKEEADAELRTLNSENEDLRSKLQQKTDEVAKRPFSRSSTRMLSATPLHMMSSLIHLKETEEKLERVGNAASESNAKIMALNRDGERLRSQAVFQAKADLELRSLKSKNIELVENLKGKDTELEMADLENLRTNVEVLSGQNSQIKAQLQEREDELEKFKFGGPAADSLTNIENTLRIRIQDLERLVSENGDYITQLEAQKEELEKVYGMPDEVDYENLQMNDNEEKEESESQFRRAIVPEDARRFPTATTMEMDEMQLRDLSPTPEASTHESITNHSDEEVYSEQLHPGMYALVDPAVDAYARIDPAELDEWYPWSASYNASKLAPYGETDWRGICNISRASSTSIEFSKKTWEH
ncbi:hypothetical protein B0H14DRAFT_2571416 [Mycena olivaceomarginata]|nr:hypothetical protein B0H14DRAFT_2571416 [Mycena olivaceomarginata]